MEPQEFASFIPVIGIAAGNIFHTILAANPRPTAVTKTARRNTESIITINLIALLMLNTIDPPFFLIAPVCTVIGFTTGKLIQQIAKAFRKPSQPSNGKPT